MKHSIPKVRLWRRNKSEVLKTIMLLLKIAILLLPFTIYNEERYFASHDWLKDLGFIAICGNEQWLNILANWSLRKTTNIFVKQLRKSDIVKFSWPLSLVIDDGVEIDFTIRMIHLFLFFFLLHNLWQLFSLYLLALSLQSLQVQLVQLLILWFVAWLFHQRLWLLTFGATCKLFNNVGLTLP